MALERCASCTRLDVEVRPVPSTAHIVDLLAAATAHQPVADAFAQGFADPAWFAGQLATPQSAAAFVADVLQLVEA